MKNRSFYFLLIFVLLIVDQITKAIVFQKIAFLSSQSIIPGFFNLTHIHNRGAIFGFFSQSDSQLLHIVLMLATLVALVFVVYYFLTTPPAEKLSKI